VTQSKKAYLTVNGRPFCLCNWLDTRVENMQLTCGYVSLAAAKRAKAELQKHVYAVRVVPGRCPTYGND
jgi:hypothetical protein